MRFSRKGFFGRIPRIVLSTVTKFMKRKKIYYNEEKNVDELKKKNTKRDLPPHRHLLVG
jgi:hypothetical protein